MYAAERGCITTLKEMLDIADAIGDASLGIAVDTYHVWWDPELAAQIARAGSRIIAHHICDWLVPTRDMLNDRGMMGDGVIDFRGDPGDGRGRGLSRRPGGGDILRPLVVAPRRRGAGDGGGAVQGGVPGVDGLSPWRNPSRPHQSP